MKRTEAQVAQQKEWSAWHVLLTVVLSSILIAPSLVAFLLLLYGDFYYGYLGTLIFVFPVVLVYQIFLYPLISWIEYRYAPGMLSQVLLLSGLYVVAIAVNLFIVYFGEGEMEIILRTFSSLPAMVIPFAAVLTILIARLIPRGL